MSDASNSHFIDMYVEQAEAPRFLSGFFQSPARNFHTTEKVEIDIIRDDEQIAIVVTDLSTGGRMNEDSVYSNKAFTPPILQEMGVISAYKTMARQAGMNPYDDPNYGQVARDQAFRIGRKLEPKIRRTIELMAAQTLSLGVVTLTDTAGTALYSLDFQAKASHMATCGSTAGYGAVWVAGGATGTPLEDLALMARTIRQDGRKVPKDLIFGRTAWAYFKSYTAVKEQLQTNFNSPGTGQYVTPVRRGSDGATYLGWITIDLYRFDMWGYDGCYRDPVTPYALVPYVDPTHVLMLSDGRLDLSYGAIPRIVESDPRAMPFLPGRISSSAQGLDLTTNAWFTPDGQNLMVSFGTRPLTIPTAIDTFGRIKMAA